MLKNVSSLGQQIQRSTRRSISQTILSINRSNQNDQLNLINKRTKYLGITKKPKLDLIQIWDGMTIKDLANETKLPISTIKEVMRDINVNDLKNLDTLKLLIKELERKYVLIKNPNLVEAKVQTAQNLIDELRVPLGEIYVPKIPVVTIMGHVDHGKTTLLDSLRNSEITKNEFGGITQHTGAFTVSLQDKKQPKKKSLVMRENFENLITFLDTPGHAAFSNMRERGTKITDFIILVIAAEDGIMPQTVESIKFAQKHDVPIIVALNKIDKLDNLNEKDYNSIIEKISRKLLENNVELESLGGDVQMIKISALEKIGFDDLKEAILAQTETLELHCIIDGGVEATIIESTVDQQKGKLTTILVQSGTLKRGDILITENGLSYIKVRTIFDENSQIVDNIRPGFSVQLIGWKTNELYTPQAGDKLIQIKDEKSVNKIVARAIELVKKEKSKQDTEEYIKKTEEHRVNYGQFLQNKRNEKKRWMKMRTEKKKFMKFDAEEENKKINIVIKADVYGTLETILELFSNYTEEQDIRINVLDYGVGAITENDIETAETFHNTVIYAFNTKLVSKNLEEEIKAKKVRLKHFNVIYHLINDLKKEIESRMPEVEQHLVIGQATVLKAFLINEKSKKIAVAGSICEKGVLKNDKSVIYKIERAGKLIAEDLQISSMRHLKDEVNEIKEKTECGLMFKDYKDVFEPGDQIICYKKSYAKPKTSWNPEGF